MTDSAPNTDSTATITTPVETSVDELFSTAEKLAQDFSLFPNDSSHVIHDHIQGLVHDDVIEQKVAALKQMDIDEYVKSVVEPSESKTRTSAKAIIKKMGYKIIKEIDKGPLYCVEVEMDFGDRFRRVGFITQERTNNNGVWLPEHHKAAIEAARGFAQLSIPVVTFMDTPGADASEIANKGNQAHSISAIIAEMCNLEVPTVGIILGLGFSGGAIPLASTNVLLSVRDGVFNTIQPKGLAGIARQYNLSWQECARYVGVSAYELYQQGNIDGIIDFVPGESTEKLVNLSRAIVSSIISTERNSESFVANNAYIMNHYTRSLHRYLDDKRGIKKNRALFTGESTTEYLNVFGLGYRYLRYLGLRKRIKSTTIENYGRLSDLEIPKGDLDQRTSEERELAFKSWFEDCDKLIYNDTLAKSWKNYLDKKASVSDERGMLARLVLGEPKKKYDEARRELQFTIGLFLYNRWKTAAEDNFLALGLLLKQMSFERFIFHSEEIIDTHGLIQAIATSTDSLSEYIRENVSSSGKKLFQEPLKPAIDAQQTMTLLVAELNAILGKAFIHTKINTENLALSDELLQMIELPHGQSKLLTNRRLLECVYGEKLAPYLIQEDIKSSRDMTVLDVMQLDDLRDGFILECQNMLIFGHVYNTIIDKLSDIAKEANSYKVLSQSSVTQLLEPALEKASKFVIERQLSDQQPIPPSGDIQLEHYQSDIFSAWLDYFISSPRRGNFLSTVEEWKKSEFPRLSDTLLVIITFFFEKLLPEYYGSLRSGKAYEGRINPMRIGRRKDFWNRLSIAYQDLLIQELITKEKRKKLTTVNAFITEFFDDFVEQNANLMSADPVSFPGFRLSIEKALRNNVQPCGVTTGIGKFKAGEQSRRMGVLISNTAFQAGAFDMAGAEKFCKLLVECASHKLPIICFVSSGGMQTKEGAASLFSMSVVNDRITRFVRDNDLPVIIFGFGDCTGGSQASFVTHPLVQTYYFSGTDMPFAGRVVVPSYLPSTATVSNYLYNVPGAMQGFVKHPFAPDLDKELREIDPDIPLPKETVTEVYKRIIAGHMEPENTTQEIEPLVEVQDTDLLKPVKTVLIHARGCTAVKLIRGAQAQGINIVLVQSDPDMESVPVDMLGPNDRVVCIGGNTSDESYLNALSVINIAGYEGVDSLHPGIGFLSESSSFASLVRQHKINFIGPHVSSMETMGNKSNAINTALKMNVPVVPGSHGILTSS
ncbi:MAG: hypothetical protein JKY67_22020, partial [Pseudomonadales bacterium]|nr:hypothetical protein [Pseudomonadales bacterium]